MKTIHVSGTVARDVARKIHWRMAPLLGASMLMLGAAGVQADDGDPDPTFGASGRTWQTWPSTIDGDTVTDVSTRSVAVLADGSTVTAGSVRTFGPDQIGIAKFKPDGFEDDAFGDDGEMLQYFRDAPSQDRALGVFAAPGNKILVVGFAEYMATFSERPAMLRMHSDGTLDTSFGNGGRIIIQTQPMGAGAAFYFRTAAMAPDGKILLVGACTNCGAGSYEDFAAVRLNPNGTVDTSFGNAGWFSFGRTDEDGHYVPEVAQAVAVDTQGRIVLAGYSEGFDDQQHQQTPLVVRLTPTGQLDTSFDGFGYVDIDVFGSYAASAVAIDAYNDGIIVASNLTNPLFPGITPTALLSRVKRDGAIDTNFGSGGFVILQYEEGTNITALSVRADRRIVAAGWIDNTGADSRDFFAARTFFNGTLDNSFDGNGVNRYSYAAFSPNSVDVPFAMILSGERPVIAGSLFADVGPNGTFATGVLRLQSNLIFADDFD